LLEAHACAPQLSGCRLAGLRDGDWRLYFDTNNGDQEWTELFSCDGCVDDDTTYQLGVSTGIGGGGNGSSPSKARSLGPDPVVFPGQNVLVHTTGYDDEVLGDDVGTVYDTDAQASRSFDSASSSGDGSYPLVYSLRPVGSVGRAVLTPEAEGLLAAYSGSPGVHCGLPVIGVTPPFVARVCTPAKPDGNFARRRVVPARDRALFENESEERDEAALTGISAVRMRREFRALRPKEQRRLVRAIRHELGTAPRRLRGDFDELVTTLDRALPARVVRRAVPPAVRRAVNRLRRERRAARAPGPDARVGRLVAPT
jgi:hypothetical protein